jgi:hypothetical protein
MTAPTRLDAQQLTSTTRVIVSFGARDGGFELTAQLRLDIMDRYGKRKVIRAPNGNFLHVESDEAFCYLDAITLGQARGTTYDKLQLEKTIGGVKQKVFVDLNKMANPYWDTYYPEAVANSAVMIFQITNPWLTSEYCLEELGWFMIQALKNLEMGRPVGCIFMVFEEAKAGFEGLLARLRQGLTTNVASKSLQGYPYARMMKALQAIQIPYAQAHTRLAAARRSHLNQLLTIMADRVAIVPPGGFDEIGFTDLYDDQQQRIKQDPRVQGTPQHMYSHDFSYKYGITQEFEKHLFSLLDPELAHVGIHPV